MDDSERGSTYGHVDGRFWSWQYLRRSRWAILTRQYLRRGRWATWTWQYLRTSRQTILDVEVFTVRLKGDPGLGSTYGQVDGEPGRGSTYGQVDGRAWTWQCLRGIRCSILEVAVFTDR